jgi:hypothetical protein
MARPVLIDGRNLFEPEAARQAGFDYSGIGRCSRARLRSEAAAPVTTRPCGGFRGWLCRTTVRRRSVRW